MIIIIMRNQSEGGNVNLQSCGGQLIDVAFYKMTSNDIFEKLIMVLDKKPSSFGLGLITKSMSFPTHQPTLNSFKAEDDCT